MKTRIILGTLAVCLLASTGAFAAWAPTATVIGAEAQIAGPGMPEADSLTTDHQCSPTVTENICCLFDATPCTSGGPYLGAGDVAAPTGDIVLMNTYYNEVVDCAGAGNCASWEILWTLGIRPGANVIFLFQDELVNFGDVSSLDGLNVTFCVAGALQLPDVANGLTIPFGFGVDTPDFPFTGPGTDPGFPVTAASACTP